MAENLANFIEREELYELAKARKDVNGHLNYWRDVSKDLDTAERKNDFAKHFTAYLFKVINHPIDFIGPTEYHYRINLRKKEDIPTFCEDIVRSDGGRQTWYDPMVVNFNDIYEYVGSESRDGYSPMFNSKVSRAEQQKGA